MTEPIEIFIRDRRIAECLEQADLSGLLILITQQTGEEELVKVSRAKKILIDHHLDPEDFTDIAITDTTKCSTAELVHEIICSMNGDEVFSGKPYAEAIYVGIITDTGNFEHGAYSRTFRIVASLNRT
jgi:phosphoesterase RecJ-like protein